MKRNACCYLVAVAALFLVISVANAQKEKTVIKLKGGQVQYVDGVSYSPSMKIYEITKGKGRIEYPEEKVEYVKPPEPDDLESTQDVRVLENILKQYRRLWWDCDAFVRLVSIYVKRGEPEKAIRLFGQRNKLTKRELPFDVYRSYWQALANSRNDDVLQKELEKTIRSGTREEVAWAYITRGDYYLGKGEYQKALVGGYLVVELLFRNISSTRKNALLGAISAYEKLEDSKAKEMRKIFKKEFPYE